MSPVAPTHVVWPDGDGRYWVQIRRLCGDGHAYSVKMRVPRPENAPEAAAFLLYQLLTNPATWI